MRKNMSTSKGISIKEWDLLGDAVGKVRRELLQRIEDLEANAVKFEGVWRSGSIYAKQSLVTDKGGIWIALRETASRPPSGDWKLAVKSGAAS